MPYLPSWGYFSLNKRERPLEVYTNQEPLLTPVIAEVPEGNDIMEEQLELEEDLPARSGDRWMKR